MRLLQGILKSKLATKPFKLTRGVALNRQENISTAK
jgi:hypothetical protein